MGSRREIAHLSLVFLACGGRGGEKDLGVVADGGGSDAGWGLAPVPPPSCLVAGPGLTDCGPAQESCCTSLEVTGGTFYRRYGGDATQFADPATVSNFRLDKYAVTVGRFRRFLNRWNAGWRPAPGTGRHSHLNGGKGLANMPTGGYEPGWLSSFGSLVAPTDANLSSCTDGGDIPESFNYSTWTETPGNRENLPIDCVNYFEAYAFCIWDGDAFIPSQAELEYAAAGGSQQREYPWGSADPGTDSEYAVYGCFFPSGSGTCSGVSNIAPVGSAPRGQGLWGQLDLAGNVWQWVMDGAFGLSGCFDCTNLDTTDESDRAIEGGSFESYATFFLAPSYRAESLVRSYDTGFRCARAPYHPKPFRELPEHGWVPAALEEE